MDNTENSFSISGSYAKQFADIQARPPAQCTRSQIRKLQTNACAKPPSTRANGSTGQINRVAVPNIDKVTLAAPPVVKKKPKGIQFDSIYVEYNDAFIKACNSLINYSRKWSDVLTTSRDVIPEEISGDIESSVGQAKLLMESKLPQFAELLYHYLSKHEGPQPVMPEDLQGWWDVAIISIDNVKNRFEKLAVLEKNQWVEEQQFLEDNRIAKLQSPGVRRSSSIHKNAKPSSGLLAFLAGYQGVS